MKKRFIHKYDSVTNKHILENEYGHKCYDIDTSKCCQDFFTVQSILGKILCIGVTEIENYEEFKENFLELYC